MAERDYQAEMLSLIQKACPPDKSGFVAAVTASKLTAELLEKDPELLSGWLMARAEQTLAAYIGEIIRSRKGNGRADRFQKVVAYYVQHACEGDVRKRACDMTGADHRFVARRYELTAKTAGLLRAFHEAVAERVGDKKTSEVYDLDTYNRQYQSITGSNPEDL